MLEGRNILFVSAHPDDVEIFAGGTVAKSIEYGANVYVALVTVGERGINGVRQTRAKEFYESMAILGVPKENCFDLSIHERFCDTQLFKDEDRIVQALEKIIVGKDINTVFTHYHSDSHADHRVVSSASLAAARNCENLLYYRPSWPSGRAPVSFSADLIVKLDESHMDIKLSALSCHQSQIKKYGKENYISVIKSIMVAENHLYTGGITGGAEIFEINRVVS